MTKRFSVFFKAVLTLCLCAGLLVSCGRNKPADGALDKDTSYAVGMLIAMEIGLNELSFDYKALSDGFRDVNEGKETRLTTDEAIEKFNAAIAKLQAENNERLWIEGEKNRVEGETFLAENRDKDGIITTASGLQYEVITQGSGARPSATDTVLVNYEGTLLDGTVFDSSYERGGPTEIPLNMVIPGWTEGVTRMNEGSTFRFFIPSELAYGPNGGGIIPPNAALIFRVELISIQR